MRPDGEILGSATFPTRLSLVGEGGVEQDPEEWWSAIVEAARELASRELVPPQAVQAVCTTAQWAGTVPVDAAGNALRDAIIWMDTRGAADARAVTGGLLSIEGYGAVKLAKWVRRTGGVPSREGKEPVAHILYLRRTEPELYEATYKFLEPKDYINLRLCGEFAASTDSIALHWVTDNRKIDQIDYDDELLAMTTIPRAKLPRLLRAIDVLGTVKPEVARALHIADDAKVVMGTPDVQSAAIGSGAVGDHQGHIYLGTSSWVTCHVAFKKTDLFRNMASLPSALPDRYFVANAQETAGACVQWLRDEIVGGKSGLGGPGETADFYAHLDRLARSVPAGSGKTLFTPWLVGERAPVADGSVRASFFNMSLGTTGAHLARAVLEGVAFNTRWLFEALERFVGERMEPLRIIGGGANSDLWCQIHADVLDREVAKVRNPVECNARGAGLIASLGLGLIDRADISKHVRVERTFSPSGDRALYDELFGAYTELYRATKGICAKLNRPS